MSRTAILFGATGLIGGHCLTRLVASPRYDRVVVVTRRPTGQSDGKLDEVRVELDRIETVAERLVGQDVFIALGTTIKKAGSQEAFRRVDHDFVLAAARVCREQGAERLALVSSLGAAATSMVFYNRVKGETEAAVSGLGYAAVHIMRPSVLAGERTESRPGERIAVALLRGIGGAMVGPLARYRAIDGDAVAAAMVRVLAQDTTGVHIHMSEAVAALASEG